MFSGCCSLLNLILPLSVSLLQFFILFYFIPAVFLKQTEDALACVIKCLFMRSVLPPQVWGWVGSLARNLLQAFHQRLHSQDVQQDVSAEGADEVQVQVEQRDFRRAALQDPCQAQEKVICQVCVPQNQLLHLIGRFQHRHHGVELQSQKWTFLGFVHFVIYGQQQKGTVSVFKVSHEALDQFWWSLSSSITD